jgi:aspartyl-tRNA(Asn)/glutamyl-tRNA(Gln) amidotransferase subunit A
MKKSSLYNPKLTIKDFAELVSSQSISCEELTEITLDRIRKLNPKLNGFITILEDSAKHDAKDADASIRRGKYKGPLHGVPISLKDLIYVKGVKSTSGSKILADFVPDYDSTVVRKLKEAGAIIVGMNNTHEFACGITNINPHYGPSRNPWDDSRMSGGSSGGSAVAVSAGMSLASIGTDTSGSIRVPSSLCGVFGLKPTYGRVSKYGVMPLAPSIDHIGPICRSPWDIAAVMQHIAGYDSHDPNSANAPVPNYIDEVEKTQGKFRLGIPKQFFFDIIDPKVKHTFDSFVERAESCQISSTHVDVDQTDKIYETWRAIRLGESATTHNEWLRTRHDDYGKDVVKMLDDGLKITAVHYISAHKWRQEIRGAILRAMKPYDALLVPTTPIAAPLLDQSTVHLDGKDIEVYPVLSRLTTVFDVTGLPALNIPAGLVDNRLPVGVQLVGRPFDEARLIQIAERYEQQYHVSEEMVPALNVTA